MRPSPLLALALVMASLTVGLVAAAPRERRFFSARHGVGVEAPVGWSLSPHTGYPDILVVLVHPSGGRISLTVAPTAARDAQSLAAESRRGLEAQHLVITRVAPGARGGVQLDARNAARGDELRQLYVVRPLGVGVRQGIVVTLVARAEAFGAAASAFDWAVAHLALETPAGADAPADAGPPNVAAPSPSSGAERAHGARDR